MTKYPNPARYSNQEDHISFGNLYMKYREDRILTYKIKPMTHAHLEALTRRKDTLKHNWNVDYPNHIFNWGPMGIIAHSKDPSGELINPNSIRDFNLLDIWFMYINIIDWQREDFPSQFLKHSVSDREILWIIMLELGYVGSMRDPNLDYNHVFYT